MLLLSLGSAILAAQLRPKVAFPDLEAEPAQIDLGRVEQGKCYTAKFQLRNRCRDEVRISKVVGSCSCTSHELSLARIPADGQSELTLTYDSGSSSGDVSSQVSVYYFRTGERKLQIVECRIAADVEPNISISPNPIRLGVDSRSVVVRFQPQRIKSFQAINVACTRAEVACQALDRLDPTDALEVQLDVDLERLPPDVRRAELLVETSDAAVPLLRVPIEFTSAK